MSVPYYGDFAEDDTVLIPFNTFTSNDPAASSTITDLADADIKVHKDGGTTEIATDGATVAINFDSVTGNHLITIDTSVDAAYSTGSEYTVRIEGATVDGGTINVWVGAFSIERAGGVIALLKLIQAAVITNAAGADVAADIIAVKAETALIVADTNELQTDDIPGTLSTIDGKIDTIDTNVDDIETDTGTTLPATLATIAGYLDTEIAAILADTNEIQGDLTNGGRLDLLIDAIKVVTDNLAASAGQIISFTVDDAVGPSTTEFEADDITEATADHYNGRIIVWTSGDLEGQATDITDYSLEGGKGHFTVTAMTEAPANNDTGVIV